MLESSDSRGGAAVLQTGGGGGRRPSRPAESESEEEDGGEEARDDQDCKKMDARAGMAKKGGDAKLVNYTFSDDDDASYWASKLYTESAVTLFDNRLSCALPNTTAPASTDLVAVVAFGNRFSAPPPS